jgi:hypothetical protein
LDALLCFQALVECRQGSVSTFYAIDDCFNFPSRVFDCLVRPPHEVLRGAIAQAVTEHSSNHVRKYFFAFLPLQDPAL